MPGIDEVVLCVDDVEIRIDLARGARATSWTVGDLSLLAAYGPEPVQYGMYPMAPWAGRLRDNAVVVDGQAHVQPTTHDEWALHGTVLAARVEAVEHDSGPGHARLLARATEHPGWPWPTHVDIEWDLRPRALTTTITVHALDTAFPSVVGWHPWFARTLSRGSAVEWTLDATGMAERGDDYLPTGRLLPYDPALGPFDDAFEVPGGRALVRWPGALDIEISGDGPWFVVFDQLSVAACIEPQSGPPNGLNDGVGRPVPMAAPGRPHRMTTTWLMRDGLPQGAG